MVKKSYLFVVLVILSTSLLGQDTILKGSVQEQGGEVINGVSVVVHTEENTNTILGYAISDAKGLFSIKIKGKHTKLAVRAMSLNYADTTILVEDFSKPILFELEVAYQKLKEVTIKARSIRMRGDTIDYRVNAFAMPKDRSIGEVISRMPGFEVAPSGRIKYQGQPIEKYYIEGLDLLEGRYALANKNLPHTAVASVEVLENHQPVKMLDSLVFSDRTSLNIRLKNKVAVTGTARLGAGVKPLLWEANVTPMFFSRKQQAIASYQANNIGDDVGVQLRNLSFTMGRFQRQDTKKKLLSTMGIPTPETKQQRYLDNNVHLFTYNHLVKLKEDVELKVNTSYLNDYKQQQGQVRTSYFQGEDTISFIEHTHKKSYTNYWKTDFIFDNNIRERYVKNKFSIHKYWDTENSNLTGSKGSFQYAKTPYFALGNNLEWIQPFRNKFLTIKSEIVYSKAPQELSISPGVFEKMLNKGNKYKELRQSWEEKSFLMNNSVQFTIRKKQWSFDSELGANIEQNRKDTRLILDKNILNQDRLTNDLEWSFVETYLKESIRYEEGSFSARISLPMSLVNYSLVDGARKNKKKKFLWQPSLHLNYQMTALWTWSAGASHRVRIADMNAFHYGYILQNYRRISMKEVPLSETKSLNGNVELKYKNPISGFFASARYSTSQQERDMIYQTVLNADGSMQYNALHRANDSFFHSMSANASKVISSLRSTFFLSASYNYQKSESLLNTRFIDNAYRYYIINPKVGFAYFDWLSVDYKYRFMQGKQKNEIVSTSFQEQLHTLQLNFYPKDNHTLSFVAENYISERVGERQETPFIDVLYRFSISKKKLDFSLKCINLLNKNQITKYYSSAISESVSSYELRPRQFLLSVRMSLGGR